MPEKIQNIGPKTQKHKSRQAHPQKLLPQAYPAVHQIHGHQHKHCAAAVDIGPVSQPPLSVDTDTVPCQHVKDREIGLYLLGKVHVPEIRLQNGAHFRDQKQSSHSPCQKRKQGKISQAPKPVSLQTQQHEKVKHQENADHNGEVEIRIDGQSQRHAVQPPPPFFHQPLQPQHNQGQQHHAVHPHDIVIICRHKA